MDREPAAAGQGLATLTGKDTALLNDVPGALVLTPLLPGGSLQLTTFRQACDGQQDAQQDNKL